MEGYQRGEGGGEWGKKVQGIRSINGRQKIRQRQVNSIGNGQAKELVCMTYGYELRWGESWREVEWRAKEN